MGSELDTTSTTRCGPLKLAYVDDADERNTMQNRCCRPAQADESLRDISQAQLPTLLVVLVAGCLRVFGRGLAAGRGQPGSLALLVARTDMTSRWQGLDSTV